MFSDSFAGVNQAQDMLARTIMQVNQQDLQNRVERRLAQRQARDLAVQDAEQEWLKTQRRLQLASLYNPVNLNPDGKSTTEVMREAQYDPITGVQTGIVTKGTTRVPIDRKQVVSYGGQSYYVPSADQQQFQAQQKAHEKAYFEHGLKLDELAQKPGFEEAAKVSAQQRLLNVLGVDVTDPDTGKTVRMLPQDAGPILEKQGKRVQDERKAEADRKLKERIDAIMSQFRRGQQDETVRHHRALENNASAQLSQAGGTTMMIPNEDGTFTAMRVAPGQTVPAGAVNASAMSSMNAPTAATRNMAEAAPKVTELANKVLSLLDANEKELGPLRGRWNEFTSGRIGLKGQGYTQVRTDTALLSSLLARMHVGARGGTQMSQKFQDLIDSSKQDPDNLRAALAEIKAYANSVAESGKPKAMQNHGSGDGSAPTITNQQQYEALPKGTRYVWNGEERVKQ